MTSYIQEHFASAVQTFVAAFLTTVGATLSNGAIEWTTAFWLAIFLTAARAAVKVVFQKYAPVALGGKR